jgi:hypothetical protein
MVEYEESGEPAWRFLTGRGVVDKWNVDFVRG